MGFSQKTVYAMRAIYELAKRYGQGPVSIATIAEAQTIPGRFLENILLQLKQSGVVASMRGKEGGYSLARPPAQVCVGDILRAIEGPIDPVSCLSGSGQDTCPMREDCVFLPMWRQAQEAMLTVYDAANFEDLVAKGHAGEEQNPKMYSI
jgi:Rrf2 family protein